MCVCVCVCMCVYVQSSGHGESKRPKPGAWVICMSGAARGRRRSSECMSAHAAAPNGSVSGRSSRQLSAHGRAGGGEPAAGPICPSWHVRHVCTRTALSFRCCPRRVQLDRHPRPIPRSVLGKRADVAVALSPVQCCVRHRVPRARAPLELHTIFPRRKSRPIVSSRISLALSGRRRLFSSGDHTQCRVDSSLCLFCVATSA
jgi:hypothetical protein